jgi:hypothetical protein
LIIVFYLSGPNMSAMKLKYNCLRYIAPGFIALNLATIIFFKEVFEYLKKYIPKTLFQKTQV